MGSSRPTGRVATLAEAIQAIKRATRRFVRHQSTGFAQTTRDPVIDAGGSAAGGVEVVRFSPASTGEGCSPAYDIEKDMAADQGRKRGGAG